MTAILPKPPEPLISSIKKRLIYFVNDQSKEFFYSTNEKQDMPELWTCFVARDQDKNEIAQLWSTYKQIYNPKKEFQG